MRVKPTKRALAATYEMLRALPPFSEWNLPPAIQVIFHPKNSGSFWGRVRRQRNGRFIIEISEHQTVSGMVATMAHEMIHVHLTIAGKENPKDFHDKVFWRCARHVCRRQGIEVGGF